MLSVNNVAPGWVGFALLLLGCTGRPVGEDDDEVTVDREVYVDGYCVKRCDRFQTCDVGSDPVEACRRQCRPVEREESFDDPCWTKRIEFERCVLQDAACEDLREFAATLEQTELCRTWSEQLDACRRR